MTPPGSGFDERVVVIEHEAFRSLWSAELDGGLVGGASLSPDTFGAIIEAAAA